MSRFNIQAVLLVISLMLSLNIVQAQSKKDLVSNSITYKATYELDYEDSNGKEYLDLEEWFDEKGNLIEEKEYKEGKLNKHKKYQYDGDGNVLIEEHFQANGKLKKKFVYEYSNGLKTSKKEYDSDEKIISAKRYDYK